MQTGEFQLRIQLLLKYKMGLRMKNFISGIHWKIRFLGGVHTKTIYRGILARDGVVSQRGEVDTPMHTLVTKSVSQSVQQSVSWSVTFSFPISQLVCQLVSQSLSQSFSHLVRMLFYVEQEESLISICNLFIVKNTNQNILFKAS